MTKNNKHKKGRTNSGKYCRKASKIEKEKVFWGIHPVLEALKIKSNQLNEIFVNPKRIHSKLQEIIARAQKENIKLSIDSKSFNKLICGTGIDKTVHQNVVAIGKPYSEVTLSDLITKISINESQSKSLSILVALDNIQDPHNMGAIIRTSLAAGVSAVLIPEERSAPLGGTAVKSSAGALIHMNICRVKNLVSALKMLKKKGVWVVGTIKDSPLSLYKTDFTTPVCIVIGSEEKGIRSLVREQCDYLVSIPMTGGLDSLNASTSAAIVLFELVRQQQMKNQN